MDLKSIILGGLISLIVTVVGGVALYYITETDKRETPLTYLAEYPTTYEGDSILTNIQTISLFNRGSKIVDSINVFIKFSEDIKISSKKISNSLGLIDEYKILKDTMNILELRIKSVLPNDFVKIALLSQSKKNYKEPSIIVRYGSCVALKEDFGKTDNNYRYLLYIGMFFILFIYFIAVYKFLKRRSRSFQSTNNTAFLFIHKGLNNEAKEILEKEILTKGGDSLIISNYALCKAIEGDKDTSIKLIEASLFYSGENMGHEKAVCLFNKSLIKFLFNTIQDGRNTLEEAYKLSPKEIKKYCANSDVVKSLRTNNEIDIIFNKLFKE